MPDKGARGRGARWCLPLHIHISTLFFLLVLMAGGSIAWVSYTRSADMMERAAADPRAIPLLRALTDGRLLRRADLDNEPEGAEPRPTAGERLRKEMRLPGV